ncbi:hypothetical protein CHH27_23665 [Labrenzia sp. VG12]|nr:hypothetical protein CHH27_23665 [Labrenzia sp. VG12]
MRDGGYYTNWDFSQECVDRYLEAVSCLPVSYIELGYRALPEYGKYKGAYYYLPLSYIESAREKLPADTKLGVMLDVKNCPPEHSAKLLQECQGLIDFVRLAADPRKLNVALELAYSIKRLGFEVGLNLMYLSSDYDKTNVLEEIQNNKGVCDIVSLVDSYGACYPTEVAQAVSLAKHILDVPVGFHGHDNLTLAFANALAALDAGADVVDGTLQGMGRGAGNLRTELIASYLESNLGNVPDFFAAAPALDHFSEMKMVHKWGAQIPYIIAGLNGLPQAPVMEWMSKKRFDMPAIVRALTTLGKDEDVQQQKKSGNVAKPLRDALPKLHDKKVVVVGGGQRLLNTRLE